MWLKEHWNTFYREQTHLFCANDQEIFSVLVFHFYRYNLFAYSYYSLLSFSVHFISSWFNCPLDSTVLLPRDETRLD